VSNSSVKRSPLQLPKNSDALPVQIELTEDQSAWVIYADDQLWRHAHPSLFGRNWHPPWAATVDEWQEQFHQLEVDKAYVYILKRLAARSMTEQQVFQLLDSCLVSAVAQAEALQRLRGEGYINDGDYAEQVARSQQRRGYGPQRIKQKLVQKGISPEVITQHQSDEEQERTAIQALLTTRYARRDLTQHKERQKVIASLMRRGFTLTVILDLIRQNSGA